MLSSVGTHDSRRDACEFKFLVSPAVAEQVRDWGRARLGPDPNGAGPSCDAYDITSLYFDTEAFDVFHRHGSYGRGKYRIRRYGQSPIAYLERKLRTGARLVKRRSAVPLHELSWLRSTGPAQGWTGLWFHARLRARHLEPVTQVSYRRTARVATTPNGLIRLTVDENLRALRAHGYGFSRRPGDPILPDHRVVELKFRRPLPLLFKNLIEEFALNLQPFSKYRQAAATLGVVPDGTSKPEPSVILPQYA